MANKLRIKPVLPKAGVEEVSNRAEKIVKVKESTRDDLKVLAAENKVSMGELIDSMVQSRKK